VTEPQVWTLIGVFAAILLGGFTLSTGLLTRVIRSGFEAVGAKFDTVNARLDHLDRNVSALMKRAWEERDDR
jgi:hypothetical protein